MAIKHFVLDVDGVLNTGQFLYSEEGKVYKIFGPDDHDGLKILAPHLQSIHFISADKRGYAITQKRVEIDMGMSFAESTDLLHSPQDSPEAIDQFEILTLGALFFYLDRVFGYLVTMQYQIAFIRYDPVNHLPFFKFHRLRHRRWKIDVPLLTFLSLYLLYLGWKSHTPPP